MIFDRYFRYLQPQWRKERACFSLLSDVSEWKNFYPLPFILSRSVSFFFPPTTIIRIIDYVRTTFDTRNNHLSIFVQSPTKKQCFLWWSIRAKALDETPRLIEIQFEFTTNTRIRKYSTTTRKIGSRSRFITHGHGQRREEGNSILPIQSHCVLIKLQDFLTI